MSFNTIEENRQRNLLGDCAQIWLFGYGSLIYLIDFPYLNSKPANIRGWSRRFWQGSHDHRGTRDNPGRVVTLIEETEAVCGGIAYLLDADVLAQIDRREKNGYLRVGVDIRFDDGSQVGGLTYIAMPDNAAYLGAASEFDIARHIFHTSGPSGSNSDYLLELAKSLRALELVDEHVFAIETHLLEMMQS